MSTRKTSIALKINLFQLAGENTIEYDPQPRVIMILVSPEDSFYRLINDDSLPQEYMKNFQDLGLCDEWDCEKYQYLKDEKTHIDFNYQDKFSDVFGDCNNVLVHVYQKKPIQ